MWIFYADYAILPYYINRLKVYLVLTEKIVHKRRIKANKENNLKAKKFQCISSSVKKKEKTKEEEEVEFIY